MIRVDFRMRQGTPCGFRVQGHAGTAPAGEDIVCAAVSSAVYLVANTVTDVLNIPAAITERDGFFEMTVPGDPSACAAILAGFRLHIQALQDQYPDRVHLMNTEV